MTARFDPDQARKEARACARAGLAAFSRAYNHPLDGDFEWRYGEEVQQRFLDLMAELLEMIEHGEVLENPEHARWRAVQAAKADPAVQTLLSKAMSKTSRARSK